MDNIDKDRGTTEAYKNTKGGAVTRDYPLIGIVKNNIDPSRSGRIQVYISDFGRSDPDDSSNWITVSYMSPFYGITSPVKAERSGAGNYLSNPHSYGWWFSQPDIGTLVVCIFIKGDINQGYYIGCIPEAGYNYMVPAIGATDNVIMNEGEASSFGGASRLPVVEGNQNNSKIAGSSNLNNITRPVHSYQASILFNQGLIRDPDRGSIGSSSMRESPSRVFGFSTPGRPIFEGGFTDETIASAAENSSQQSNLKIIGRRGGHSIVMDDGDIVGKDQLLRIRTSAGHQILLNDYAQTLFIIHSNGQSYVELGKEGTVDVYSTNSINFRTQGDINFHADRNINMHAGKDLKVFADSIKVNSTNDYDLLVGSNFNTSVGGNNGIKVNGSMTQQSSGSMGVVGSSTSITGQPINLNSGDPGFTPIEVTPIALNAHTDTLYDSAKGYASAPESLTSITSRAPAHTPWAFANKGVDVSVTLSSSSVLPSSPSPDIANAVVSAPSVPSNPVSPSLVATVPSNISDVGGNLSKSIVSGVVAQNALSAALGPASAAVQAGAGVVDINGSKTAVLGALGQTPADLVKAGVLKPGSDVVVNKLISEGKSLETAIPGNLFTGKDGIKDLSSFTNNIPGQVNAMVTNLTKGFNGLKDAGSITGSESPASIAGLVNTAAKTGIDNAKGLIDGTKNLNEIAGGAESMASGSFGAGIADKITGAIGGLTKSLSNSSPLAGLGSALESLKGLSGAAFSKIVNGFPSLSANKPVNLATGQPVEEPRPSYITDPVTGELVKNYTPEELAEMKANNGKLNTSLTNMFGFGNISDTLNKGATFNPQDIVKQSLSKISGAAAAATSVFNNKDESVGTGLNNLQGGLSSVSNIVDKSTGSNLTSSLPKNFTDAASNIKSLATGLPGKIGGLKGLLESKVPGAESIQIDSALSSITSDSPVKINAPSIGSNTFDATAILNKSKSLLGDIKIPSPSFSGAKPINPALVAANSEYDRIAKELEIEEETSSATRKNYLDKKVENGPDDPATIAAFNLWKSSEQKVIDLRNQAASAAKTALG